MKNFTLLIDKKNSLLNIFMLFMLFMSLVFISCSEEPDELLQFFQDNAYAAEVSSVEFSGSHARGKSGAENIPSGEDYSLYFYISNPAGTEINADLTFANENVDADFEYDQTSGKLTVTYADSLLSTIDGSDSSDISPTITLTRAGLEEEASEEEILRATEDIYTLDLTCNSPPLPVYNAQARMYSEDGNFTDRLVLVIEVPSSIASDTILLTASENGNTHNFDVSSASLSPASGENWTITQTAPSGLESTYEDQEDFECVNGGSVWYIITDIDSITSKSFYVSYNFYDEEGLASDTYRHKVPEASYYSVEGSVQVEIAEDIGFSYTSSNSDPSKISSSEVTQITFVPTLDGTSVSLTITDVVVSSGSTELATYSSDGPFVNLRSTYIRYIGDDGVKFTSGIYAGTVIRIFVSGTYNGQSYGTTLYFTVE